MIYDDDDAKPFYDRPELTLDRLVRFIVVAENVPGSDFCTSGCMGSATRIGLELGLTVEQAHDKVFDRFRDYLTIFERDRSAFIKSVALVRQQYGDERLKSLYALKQ